MAENNHILITGANGFVGTHLSKALMTRGFRVSRIVRSIASDDGISAQNVVDLTARANVEQAFSLFRPDYVIHLAGSKGRVNDAAQFYDLYNENVSMSLNIIGACRLLRNFKRLIFLGTCEEYGQVLTPYIETQKEKPTSAYGLSKLAVTQILTGLFHSHQFPSVVLRPTVIYGPGQGGEMFLSALIQTLLSGKDFAMTGGEQYRDFIYINDVVDAIVKTVVADERVDGRVLNVGAGISFQVKAVAIMVANLIHPELVNHIKFGAVQYRPNEIMDYSVVITRAKELLGWEPSTDMRSGAQQTIEQFKGYGNNA
jgi:UDP-glucose 4-epimerase